MPYARPRWFRPSFALGLLLAVFAAACSEYVLSPEEVVDGPLLLTMGGATADADAQIKNQGAAGDPERAGTRTNIKLSNKVRVVNRNATSTTADDVRLIGLSGDITTFTVVGNAVTIAGTGTVNGAAGWMYHLIGVDEATDVFEIRIWKAPKTMADPDYFFHGDVIKGNLAVSGGSADEIPKARDDAYQTPLNTDLWVMDGPGDLLDNDDLGSPDATLTTFGGLDMGGTVADNAATPAGSCPAGTPVTGPAPGHTLEVCENGEFHYEPPAGFQGDFMFLYRIANTVGDSVGKVTISVGSLIDAVDDEYEIAMNTELRTGAPGLLMNDVLGSPPAKVVSWGGGDVPGSVTDHLPGDPRITVAGHKIRLPRDDGRLVFIPAPGFTGIFTFMYRIMDGGSLFDDGTVTICVGVPCTSAPDAMDDMAMIEEFQTLNGDLTADNSSGPDVLGNPPAEVVSFGGGSLSGTVTNFPVPSGGSNNATLAGGTLVVNSDGTFSLTPGAGGTYTFFYRLQNTAGFDDAEVTIFVKQLDFGDAPDPFAATAGEYPTLLANDGARHLWPTPVFLGGFVDIEPDGQPTAAADGDDTDVQGDDDEGVSFTSALARGFSTTVDVSVTAPGAAKLNAWVDFNQDGDWTDPGEQVFTDEAVTGGVNSLTFAVPAGATLGTTFARFRVNTAGGLGPAGFASDGEVEDYQLTVVDPEFDFGDAPDPFATTAGEYPTLLANGGARHLLGSGLTLGAAVDAEADGQPDASATGDDLAGATPDDEDGVVVTSTTLPQGLTATVDVTSSGAGLLNAWVDFNQDGDWADAGEQVFTDESLTAGVNSLSFAVPGGASLGTTFARFRLDTGGGLAPAGLALNGEVEDYQVEVAEPAPADDGYDALPNVGIDVTSFFDGLLANDPPGVTVTKVQAGAGPCPCTEATDNGGEVTVKINGRFTYEPPAGFTGTDEFVYFTNGASATVTLTVGGGPLVWFVDNDASTSDNTGTFLNPFKILADFEAVNGGAGTNDPAAGDFIYVYENGAGDYTGGVTLEDDQRLYGDPFDLTTVLGTIPPLTHATFDDGTSAAAVNDGSSTRPTIVNSTGDGITLASGNTIRGLNVGNTSGYGLVDDGGTVGGLTVTDMAITGIGGPIEIQNGSGAGASMTFDELTSTGSTTEGINFDSYAGSFSVTPGGTTIDNGGGIAIRVANSASGASFDFGATNIGQTSSTGITRGIDLQTSASASFTFDALNVTTTGGVGLLANGAGTLNIGGTSNTVDVTGFTGIDLTGMAITSGITFSSVTASGGANGIRVATSSTAGPVDLTFSTVDIDNTTSHGILLTSNAANLSVNVNGGTIDGAAADGINSTNSTLSVDLTQLGPTSAIGDDGIEIVNTDAQDRTVSITNSNIGIGNAVGNRGVFINSTGTGTLTATVTANAIAATNQTILTNDAGSPVSLVLDLQNSTLTTTTASTFTQEHVGSGLNSTIVRSWDGPNQVIGGAPGSGGILFDQVTFDASGASLGGTQVIFGGTNTLTIGSAGGRVSGDGLSLIDPTGNLRIDEIAIFNTNGTGLEVDATGGTTFSICGGSNTSEINTTTGVAVDIQDATIGACDLTFESISADGATNGIVLDNTGTSGGFTVTGIDGPCGNTTMTLDCDGGTIQNTTGDGILLTDVQDVSLSFMSIHDTDDDGIVGTRVDGFEFINSSIFDFGNMSPTGTNENAMTFIDLTGTVNITDSKLGPDGNFVLTPNPPLPENDGVEVRNEDEVTLNMTVHGSQFTQISNDGIDIQGQNSDVNLDVGDGTSGNLNTFSQLNGRAVNLQDSFDAVNNSVFTIDVLTNIFTSVGIGGRWSISGGSDITANFNTNTMTSTANDAVRSLINPGATGFTSTLDATIKGNTMGTGGLFIVSRRQGVSTVRVGGPNSGDANTGIGGAHFDPFFVEASRGGVMNIDILNNTMSADAGSPEFSFATLTLQTADPGGTPVGGTTMCANVGGTGTFDPNTISLANAAANFAEPVQIDIGSSTTIDLESFTGTTAGAAATFLNGQNINTPALTGMNFLGIPGMGGNCVP